MENIMDCLKETLKFVKKNKTRFTACVVLELVFLIVFVLLFLNNFEATKEDRLRMNEILDEASENSEAPFNTLVEHGDESEELRKNIEKESMNFVIGVFIAFNLIYSIIFGLIFKNIKSWFIAKFIAINVIVQGLLIWLFNIIVDIKASFTKNLILSEKSIISVVIFVIIAYAIYFVVMIVVVELRNEKILLRKRKFSGVNKVLNFINNKEGIKKTAVKTINIIRKKVWRLLSSYIILTVLFFCIIIMGFLLMFNESGLVGLLLSMLTIIVILPSYLVFAKIYFYECVKKCEIIKKK